MKSTIKLVLNDKEDRRIKNRNIFTFFAIVIFYFFEAAQISYFNVLAPGFLSHGSYGEGQIASLSAAYYYGNMVSLLPVGIALDHFSLRKSLLVAVFFSMLGAFLLLVGHNFYLEWFGRFMCGFFGGAFSFIGGIRILSSLFPERFTFYMGIFLAAGMFGGLVCQYPLLLAVNQLGTQGAIFIMAMISVLVFIINLIFLHPEESSKNTPHRSKYPGTAWQMCKEIVTNLRNWLDCFMVVLLDLPVSIIGTLWGVILLMGFYHFSDATSAWIVMCLFAGLMIGLPIAGALSDRYKYSPWIIIGGGGVSFIIALSLLFVPPDALFVAGLFFCLGLFSSCQTLGFTWLMQGMRPELIGRNSAFNSMILMGSSGAFKQVGAWLLASPPFIVHLSSYSNLLLLIFIAMGVAVFYVCIRKILFKFI